MLRKRPPFVLPKKISAIRNLPEKNTVIFMRLHIDKRRGKIGGQANN